MIVYRRGYGFGTVGSTCNVMIVHDSMSFLFSVTLCTYNRVAPRYQSFGSRFAAGALLVHTDASRSRGFMLKGSNRVALWWFFGIHAVLAYKDSNDKTPALPSRSI